MVGYYSRKNQCVMSVSKSALVISKNLYLSMDEGQALCTSEQALGTSYGS